jgi:hypothetical protein
MSHGSVTFPAKIYDFFDDRVAQNGPGMCRADSFKNPSLQKSTVSCGTGRNLENYSFSRTKALSGMK